MRWEEGWLKEGRKDHKSSNSAVPAVGWCNDQAAAADGCVTLSFTPTYDGQLGIP